MKTQRASVLPTNFDLNYPQFFYDQDKGYNINSFQQIGAPDPFPLETMEYFLKPKDFSDLVYKKDRYAQDCSPAFVFIPSKILMLKLMRACIEVHREEDLWFN